MRRRTTRWRITTRMDYSTDFCGDEVVIMMIRRRKEKKTRMITERQMRMRRRRTMTIIDVKRS